MHSTVFFIVVHMTITMCLAVGGNLFMIFVIWRGNRAARRRISPVQFLLLHTCAADLLFALCCLGTEILLMLIYPFQGSAWLCKAIRYTQMVPLYASPFLLVAISADRYQAICRPLAHYRRNRYKIPTYLAICAWALALICSIPQVFIWGKFGKNQQCATFYGHGTSIIKSVYVVAFNTIAWLLPSIMAGWFYYKVCKAVWMSYNSRPQLDLTTARTSQCDSTETENYVTRLRKKSCGIRRQTSEFDRKRMQTVRLTLTIIACNFFLWAPFCVVNVLQANAPSLLSPSLMVYVVVLGNLNSCVNPWIYILFNRSHVHRAFCGASKSADKPRAKPIIFTTGLQQKTARDLSYSQRSTTYSSCSRMGTTNGISELSDAVVSNTHKNSCTTTTRVSATTETSALVIVPQEKRKSRRSRKNIKRARSICVTKDEKRALLEKQNPPPS
ncbi:unnamed protein product, partial [Mesorhabditis spiculigera]